MSIEGGKEVGMNSIEELTAFDEATRLTFAGRTDLPAAVQQAVADLKLVAGVPECVAKRFERCRKLFIYGCFAYEFFTVAAEYALMTEEVALRERIRQKNPNAAPQNAAPKNKAMKNAKASPAQGPWLDSRWATLAPLIEVAIQEGVLTADAAHLFSLKHPEPDPDEVDEAKRQGWTINTRSAAVDLRNLTAHGRETMTLTPPMARMTLETLAALINHLWRADTAPML
jgi:hypothetical protein